MIHDVIYEYENILLGKKKGFASTYFEYSPEQNEQTALLVFHHAINSYLKWTPRQVEERFNWKIIHRMKLHTLMKHIQFPPESDPKKDLFILYGKLYPQNNKSALKDLTISMYNRILSGERSKFPKGYFDSTEGLYRSIICFQHMLTLMKPFDSTASLYKCFASNKGTAALKKYKLSLVCNAIYETPIDYLHTSLPKDCRDDYLYHMYKFNLMYKKFLADKKMLADSKNN